LQVKQFMNKYGRNVTLHRADGWHSERYGAFIQPLRYKNKMYLYGVNTQIGYNSHGHYLYIGPPEHNLTGLDSDIWLECDGVKYQIDRAERVYVGAELFYIWAVIRTVVEEDPGGEEAAQ